MRSVLATLLLASGCLSVPDKAQPMCTSSADCNTGAGEVCSDGVCYGNPPAGSFAAVIGPPSDRVDLVSIEMPVMALPKNGDLGVLPLEAPGTFAGRLEAFCTAPNDCSSRTSLGATITITRPSGIPNGQEFRAVVTSHGGATVGASFQVSLPRSHMANDYTVLIVPEGRGDMPDGTITAAQLVPPTRMTVTVGPDIAQQTIELGTPNLALLDGTLTSSSGFGLGSYRVVALGHWVADAEPVEVSTVDYTGSDGKFRLILASDLVGTIEVVAKPYGAPAPTLHVANVDATKPPANLYMISPATAGGDKVVDIHVSAADGSGKKQDVSGARVTIDGLASTGGPQIGKYATLTASDTTDAHGMVHLHVLDGALLATTYKMRIVPPASSIFGVVYGQPMGPGSIDVTLPPRVAVRGVIANASGDPLMGVSVTAHPSLGFSWNLEGDAQRFLTEIPPATTTTPNTGEFVVWVDPIVATVFGHYDLAFEPSDTTLVPRWSTQVDMPRDVSTSVSLDTLQIPAPAFLHGHLVDPNGVGVQDGEIKLFQVVTNTALCSMVAHAPAGCPIPAPLVGRGVSDAMGVLRLAVPRP